ncbi:MAG: hypothetical protein K2N06_07835 [Oscillospiraceae bacterium]|nr:hypothetical protein [Oscillospiraceae bacterium]
MSKRVLIAAALFGLGFLMCAGAVGSLDYLDASGVVLVIGEIWAALGKGAVGIAMMAAGMFVGRDLEFEEGEP